MCIYKVCLINYTACPSCVALYISIVIYYKSDVFFLGVKTVRFIKTKSFCSSQPHNSRCTYCITVLFPKCLYSRRYLEAITTTLLLKDTPGNQLLTIPLYRNHPGIWKAVWMTRRSYRSCMQCLSLVMCYVIQPS